MKKEEKQKPASWQEPESEGEGAACACFPVVAFLLIPVLVLGLRLFYIFRFKPHATALCARPFQFRTSQRMLTFRTGL